MNNINSKSKLDFHFKTLEDESSAYNLTGSNNDSFIHLSRNKDKTFEMIANTYTRLNEEIGEVGRGDYINANNENNADNEINEISTYQLPFIFSRNKNETIYRENTDKSDKLVRKENEAYENQSAKEQKVKKVIFSKINYDSLNNNNNYNIDKFQVTSPINIIKEAMKIVSKANIMKSSNNKSVNSMLKKNTGDDFSEFQIKPKKGNIAVNTIDLVDVLPRPNFIFKKKKNTAVKDYPLIFSPVMRNENSTATFNLLTANPDNFLCIPNKSTKSLDYNKETIVSNKRKQIPIIYKGDQLAFKYSQNKHSEPNYIYNFTGVANKKDYYIKKGVGNNIKKVRSNTIEGSGVNLSSSPAYKINSVSLNSINFKQSRAPKFL